MRFYHLKNDEDVDMNNIKQYMDKFTSEREKKKNLNQFKGNCTLSVYGSASPVVILNQSVISTIILCAYAYTRTYIHTYI